MKKNERKEGKTRNKVERRKKRINRKNTITSTIYLAGLVVPNKSTYVAT